MFEVNSKLKSKVVWGLLLFLLSSFAEAAEPSKEEEVNLRGAGVRLG